MKKLIPAALIAMLTMLAGNAASAVTALVDWDYGPLYYDWRVSSVMGGPVYSNDGERVGSVHDIVISATGLIDSVIVEQSGDDGQRYFEMKWLSIDFDPALGSVTLLKSQDQIARMSKKDTPAFKQSDEWEVSDLLGMPVNTSGGERYGKIGDLLFDAGSDDLTAYVIERKGTGARLYAVEWDTALIDMDGEVITLPYTLGDLTELEVFVFQP